MPTLDDLAASLTSTEAITTGTEAQTYLTAAVSLTAGGPGSIEVTDTNSPGQALSERAQLEAQLSRALDKAFSTYLAEVTDDTMRQPTTALTAGLTLTLGTVMRRWSAFIKKVAGKFGAIFGVGDSYVEDLITRLANGAVPGHTLEVVQQVLLAEGDSADIRRKLTDALSENLQKYAAERVVRTEATSAFNQYRLEHLTTPYKRWVAHHDSRTRHSHLEADGQVVKVDQFFRVGNDLMMYPGDHRGSAGNVVNCRCVLVGVDDRRAAHFLTCGSLTAGGPGSGRYPKGSGKNPQSSWRNPKGGGYAKQKPEGPVISPAPRGHVPTADEVEKARSSRPDPWVNARGELETALYLEAAGYLDPPVVLPTEQFDSIPTEPYWRGMMPSPTPVRRKMGNIDQVTPTAEELFERTITDSPSEAFVGSGYMANGTHIGSAMMAKDYADDYYDSSVKLEHTVVRSDAGETGKVYLRTKLHPDARVINLRDVPDEIRENLSPEEMSKWLVSEGYDALDFSLIYIGHYRFPGQQAIVVVNRGVLIIEEPA